jgi:hypothetical protein
MPCIFRLIRWEHDVDAMIRWMSQVMVIMTHEYMTSHVLPFAIDMNVPQLSAYVVLQVLAVGEEGQPGDGHRRHHIG